MPSLFDPVALGDIACSNRVFMAPLTRNRAGPGQVPTALMAQYYTQRASAGLLISEATQISPLGQGYLDTPGLHSAEQVQGWKAVTAAVHAAGGRIVAQLWHVGRISHVSLLPPGEVPVSSSAGQASGRTLTAKGLEPVSPARALRLDEIPGVIRDYAVAARNAIEAGFDGVEVHGANGYLLDQFLRASINQRNDAYGGPIAHRARLMVEVMQAVAEAIGARRTGLRLSPVTPSNGAAADADAQALHGHVIEQIAPLGLAFLHVIEGATGGTRDIGFDYAALHRRWKALNPNGGWIVNNGYSGEMAQAAVRAGHADAVAFGRPFIANPDLVRRLHDGLPLATPKRETFYGGGAEGYTDYPAWRAEGTVAA